VLTDERIYQPEARQDKRALASVEALLQKPLKILDEHLIGREYLLGYPFTVADLNVASPVLAGFTGQYDLTPFANLWAWVGRWAVHRTD
jgi:glutathione S-transferase